MCHVIWWGVGIGGFDLNTAWDGAIEGICALAGRFVVLCCVALRCAALRCVFVHPILAEEVFGVKERFWQLHPPAGGVS